jgi:hypothetical protein
VASLSLFEVNLRQNHAYARNQRAGKGCKAMGTVTPPFLQTIVSVGLHFQRTNVLLV